MNSRKRTAEESDPADRKRSCSESSVSSSILSEDDLGTFSLFSDQAFSDSQLLEELNAQLSENMDQGSKTPKNRKQKISSLLDGLQEASTPKQSVLSQLNTSENNQFSKEASSPTQPDDLLRLNQPDDKTTPVQSQLNVPETPKASMEAGTQKQPDDPSRPARHGDKRTSIQSELNTPETTQNSTGHEKHTDEEPNTPMKPVHLLSPIKPDEAKTVPVPTQLSQPVPLTGHAVAVEQDPNTQIQTSITQSTPDTSVTTKNITASGQHSKPETSSDPSGHMDDNDQVHTENESMDITVIPSATRSPKPSSSTTTYNIHIFREDLVEIKEQEMENLTDNLIDAQLEGSIILDLKGSFKNKERRSYTIKTEDREGAKMVMGLIEHNITFKDYLAFCANLSEESTKSLRMVTTLPPSFKKYIERGTLIKLLTVGSKAFLNSFDAKDLKLDLQLRVPPKVIEATSRTSIIYDLSSRYKTWLTENNYKIRLMGKTLSFANLKDVENKHRNDPFSL